MKEKGAFSWTIALVILAAIIAVAVMIGANLFDIDPINLLAVSILALAAAVVIPG